MTRAMFSGGKRGAVSFTYDDALAEHLDIAMPHLESRGLRGTFYIPTRQQPKDSWHTRPADWVAAVERGHEIGNHSQYHPCKGAASWVKPEYARERYDLARMEAELRAANDDLDVAVGHSAERSFAYPCCDDWVGEEHTSMRPLADQLFPVSRGGGSRQLADPATVDFRFVPSWALVPEVPRTDILAFINEAIDLGQWAVLMFHGVGGGGHRMNVTREDHEAICQHVAERKADLHCDTFLNVAKQLRASFNRPWAR